MKTEQIALYGGIGLAAYFLLIKPKATGTTVLPGGTVIPSGGGTTPIYSGGTGSALIGINSGVKGGNGSFYTVANYSQLLAANPNLGNPNYQMTQAESTQYLANYSDLNAPGALPSWIGKKQPDGFTPQNIQQACWSHWKFDGCAEKRIFLPLQPPSTAAYIPPPVNPTASGGGGSSWVSSALGVATAIIGILGTEQLNHADCEKLFCMSAVIKDILSLYADDDPLLTRAIDVRLNALLNEYSV